MSNSPINIEIWLPHQIDSGQLLDEEFRTLAAHFKAKGYGVAVFESGTASLTQATSQLLRHNRALQGARPKQACSTSMEEV